MSVGLKVWHTGKQLFHCFDYVFYIYLNISQYNNTLFSFTLFHVSHSALSFTQYSGTLSVYRQSLKFQPWAIISRQVTMDPYYKHVYPYQKIYLFLFCKCLTEYILPSVSLLIYSVNLGNCFYGAITRNVLYDRMSYTTEFMIAENILYFQDICKLSIKWKTFKHPCRKWSLTIVISALLLALFLTCKTKTYE